MGHHLQPLLIVLTVIVESTAIDVLCSVQGLCQGNTIDIIDAQSEVDCWAKCKDDDGCAWYSLDTIQKSCYLLQNCPTIDEDLEYFTSGQVTCQFGTSTLEPTISTTPSPDKGYTKLLVTTGYKSGYINSSEVIDLFYSNVTCQQWPDYPIGVRYAVGGYLDDYVITCGGYSNDGVTDRCFKMEPSKVTEITDLETGSYVSGGGIIQDSFIISGGVDDNGTYLSRFELLNERGATNGPKMPIPLHSHCNIPIDEDQFLTTGGYWPNNGVTRKTWYFNFSSQKWSSGPDMIDSRYFHACGKFMMGNQVVLIVSGNSGDDSSVEFFPLNDESNWIRGPSLPFNPFAGAHFILSNSNTTYLIDTHFNQILKLVCPSDLSSCYWMEMDQKLKYPRDDPIVTLIPGWLTICM